LERADQENRDKKLVQQDLNDAQDYLVTGLQMEVGKWSNSFEGLALTPLKESFEVLKDLSEKPAKELGKSKETLQEVYTAISDFEQKLAEAVQPLQDTISNAIQTALNNAGNATESMTYFNEMMTRQIQTDFLNGIIQGMIQSEALKPYLATLNSMLQENVATALAGGGIDGLNKTLEYMRTNILPVMQQITGIAGQVMTEINTMNANANVNVNYNPALNTGAFNTQGTLGMETQWAERDRLLQEQLDKQRQAEEQAAEEAQRIADEAAEKKKQQIEELVGYAKNGLSDVLNASNYQEGFNSWKESAYNSLVDGVTQAMMDSMATKAIEPYMAGINDIVQESINTGDTSKLKDALQGLKPVLNSLEGQFEEVFDLNQAIKDIKKMGTLLKDVSKNIVSSAKEGLTSGLSEALKTTDIQAGMTSIEQSMKQGIYDSVVSGLIEGFMQSAMIQAIFEPFETGLQSAIEQGIATGTSKGFVDSVMPMINDLMAGIQGTADIITGMQQVVSSLGSHLGIQTATSPIESSSSGSTSSSGYQKNGDLHHFADGLQEAINALKDFKRGLQDFIDDALMTDLGKQFKALFEQLLEMQKERIQVSTDFVLSLAPSYTYRDDATIAQDAETYGQVYNNRSNLDPSVLYPSIGNSYKELWDNGLAGLSTNSIYDTFDIQNAVNSAVFDALGKTGISGLVYQYTEDIANLRYIKEMYETGKTTLTDFTQAYTALKEKYFGEGTNIQQLILEQKEEFIQIVAEGLYDQAYQASSRLYQQLADLQGGQWTQKMLDAVQEDALRRAMTAARSSVERMGVWDFVHSALGDVEDFSKAVTASINRIIREYVGLGDDVETRSAALRDVERAMEEAKTAMVNTYGVNLTDEQKASIEATLKQTKEDAEKWINRKYDLEMREAQQSLAAVRGADHYNPLNDIITNMIDDFNLTELGVDVDWFNKTNMGQVMDYFTDP
ncbi:MAG: hypothetical protein HQK77_20310, partial [Desulfobacterales bacterium]|nr:hypothetical protein [Desulfobacterales bacterium]